MHSDLNPLLVNPGARAYQVHNDNQQITWTVYLVEFPPLEQICRYTMEDPY